MKLDIALSNGPACISAEWIHELTIWEHEGYVPDDCLPTNQIVAFTSFGSIASLPLAAQDIGPDEARLLAGSAQAAILT